MKKEEIVVCHLNDKAWSQNKDQGQFKWKYMVDSTQMISHGLSYAVLVLTPGEELPPSSPLTSGSLHYSTRKRTTSKLCKFKESL